MITLMNRLKPFSSISFQTYINPLLPKIIRRKHVHRICYTHYESRQFTTCNFDIIIPDNPVIKRVDIKTPPKGFEILCSIGTYKMTACIFLHAFYTHLSPILPLIEMLKPVSSISFQPYINPMLPLIIRRITCTQNMLYS